TAAVYLSSGIGEVLQRIWYVRNKLLHISHSIGSALINFIRIFFTTAFGIFFLYQSLGSSIVFGYCDANFTVIDELILLLYQSFAEGTLADDKSAIVVLNSPADNFAGRGRPFIYKYDDGHIFEFTVALR